MAGLAEDKVLIIEFGTYAIKLKVGTDDVGSLPNLEIRSQIGVPETLLTPFETEGVPRNRRISDQDLQAAFKAGKLVMGSKLSNYLSGEKLTADIGPISLYETLNEDGVADWPGLKLLLIHLLVRELEITLDDNDSAVLTAVPLSWPKAHLELLAQLIFESLNAPALYILPQPLATLYGYGVGNGLVVDFGYTSTKLTPVIESCVVGCAHHALAFGTKDLDTLLLGHFADRPELQATFSGVKLDLDLVQYLREAGHINFAKKEQSQVEAPSQAPSKPDPEPSSNQLKFEYSGSTIEVDEALLEVDGLMFPSGAPSQTDGLALLMRRLMDSILGVIERCDAEKRTLLWENVALSGGFSCAKGLGKCLEQALQARLPGSENKAMHQPTTAKVLTMPEYFSKWKGNQHLATMLGSTIAAKFVFQDPKLHVTKLDYSEFGPQVIHNKSA